MNSFSSFKRFFPAILLLLFAGCSQNAAAPAPSKSGGNKIRCNIYEEPSSIDPRKANSLKDINITKAFMEGLFRIGKKYAPEKALAASYTVSKDGLTYTFTLRNAKWSTGDRITAHDFAYSIKSSLSPRFEAPNAHLLFILKNAEAIKKGNLPMSMLGIEAKNPSTLVLRLERPAQNIEEQLTHPIFFPIHAATDKQNPTWALEAATYVSSGPFKPAEWKHNDILLAHKNTQYWDEKAVSIKELEMKMVTADVELSLYTNEELDWAGAPLASLSPELRQSQIDKLKESPFAGTKFIACNTTHPLLSNVKARRALAAAIERTALLQHKETPAFQFTTTKTIQNESLTAAEENAPKLFKEALKELKIQENAIPPLTLSINCAEQNKTLALALQEQWKNILGIPVEIKELGQAALYKQLRTEHYDLALTSWIVDPSNFLEKLGATLPKKRTSSWENNPFVEALQEAARTTGAQQKTAAYEKCEAILKESTPLIPLMHYTELYLQNDSLQGVILAPTGGIDFKYAYKKR